MSLDHLPHQIQEHLHNTWRVGFVGKDATALNNEITEEIKQNSLRPGRVLALLPVGLDNIKSTSIKGLLQLGRRRRRWEFSEGKEENFDGKSEAAVTYV